MTQLLHLHPLITTLKSCKTLLGFQQIHAQIIHFSLHSHNYLITNFISHFFHKFKTNSHTENSAFLLHYPTSIFHLVDDPNDYLCNAFLKGIFENGSLPCSLSLFAALRASGFCPGNYTFPPLIKSCATQLKDLVGIGVHGLSVKYGTDDDLFVGSSLIDFYAKLRLLGSAQKVFDEMSVRNVVSWTTLEMMYANYGDLGSARKVFDEMPTRNLMSWNVMISGYVKKGELDEAQRLFDAMPWKNVVTFTTMVSGYAKRGYMLSAEMLFRQCREKDCFLWSALISGYAQNGQPDMAVEYYKEMLMSKIRPDEYTMVSVMSACAQLGVLDLAREVDSYVMNHTSFDRCRPHVVAGLVHMNAKCGDMDRAIYLFNSMPKRDVVSYCTMIQGYAIHGQGTDAVQLFHNMISEGIVPDDVAFTIVLIACSRSRLVEQGCWLFDMMRNDYLIDPSAEQYSCMVDLLSRCGHLNVAYDILKETPGELHREAWSALLEACKLYGNTELAELVATRLNRVKPGDGGNSVLLSNVCAEADRWLDVSTLRGRLGS